MRVLIADDDPVGALMLGGALGRWGLESIVARNGEEAWQIVQEDPAVEMAILDWMMPTVDGLELCRRIRRDARRSHLHLIMLTARGARADVVAGLDAGADDYLIKPFDVEELRARVQVGIRIVTLQARLAEQVVELQDALSKVKHLSGLLPMCSYCKSIRSDENYWEQVESYLSEHTDARLSHGICPPCYDKYLAELERSRYDARVAQSHPRRPQGDHRPTEEDGAGPPARRR